MHEIKFPTQDTYWIAYTNTDIFGYGVCSPEQEMTTGQPYLYKTTLIANLRPMKLTDSTANALATTSFVSWLSAISTLYSPIISAIGGLIAIVTGVMGMLYYYKKLKR
jgi:hypothetical protein